MNGPIVIGHIDLDKFDKAKSFNKRIEKQYTTCSTCGSKLYTSECGQCLDYEY